MTMNKKKYISPAIRLIDMKTYDTWKSRVKADSVLIMATR